MYSIWACTSKVRTFLRPTSKILQEKSDPIKTNGKEKGTDEMAIALAKQAACFVRNKNEPVVEKEVSHGFPPCYPAATISLRSIPVSEWSWFHQALQLGALPTEWEWLLFFNRESAYLNSEGIQRDFSSPAGALTKTTHLMINYGGIQ